LVLLSKSFLVKYLDGDDGRWSNSATKQGQRVYVIEIIHKDLHIKKLVPRWAETFSDGAGGVCLVCVNGDHSEWVRESEKFSFYERIGSKDWG